MSFSQAIAYCFQNYAKFNGRASRSEFWFFYLFNILVVGIPATIGSVVMASTSTTSADGVTTELGAGGVIGLIILLLAGLVSIGLIIPNLAVAARRLHDRGTSGWLLLLGLVPCGSLVLLIFWLLESQGPNSYGEGPAQA